MKKLFLLLIAILTVISSVEAKKKVRRGQRKAKHGRFDEPNAVRTFPYTMFYKTPAFNLNTEVTRIQSNITAFQGSSEPDEIQLYEWYNQIYQTVNSTDWINRDRDKDIGGSGKLDDGRNYNLATNFPIWAKNCAFIYLIGVDEMGFPLNTTDLNKARDASVHLLRNFRTELNRIVNIDHGVQDPSMYRCREILQLCQAYDMLRAANQLRSGGISDNTFDEIKFRLQDYTQKYYDLFLWKITTTHDNNLTIMGAGVLGTASIVLNDCGHRKNRGNWHPENWANAANFIIEKNLWRIRDNNATRGQSAGYSEGPHYFLWAFETCLPYFRARSNWVQTDYTREYTFKKLFRWDGGISVRNFNYDQDILNLYKWVAESSKPNGNYGVTDNSKLQQTGNGLLSLHFNRELPGRRNDEFISGRLSNFNMASDLRADLIIASNFRRKNEKTGLGGARYNTESGDLVIKSSDESMNDIDAHYIKVNAETGSAINGGGHEHEDGSSLMISAGEDDLIINPGFFSYGERKLTNKNDFQNLVLYKRTNAANFLGPNKKDEMEASPMESATPRVRTGKVTGEFDGVKIERSFDVISENNFTFYVVRDKGSDKGDNNDRDFRLRWNGNGSQNDNTCNNVGGSDFMVRWTYPCDVLNGLAPPDRHWGNWSIQSFVGVAGGGSVARITTIDQNDNQYINNGQHTINENVYYPDPTDPNKNNVRGLVCVADNDDLKDQNRMYRNSDIRGLHSRQEIDKTGKKVSFLTVHWPFKCGTTPPDMSKDESGGQIRIIIQNAGPDSFSFALMATNFNNVETNTTAFDPLLNMYVPIKYRGYGGITTFQKNNLQRFKNCLAYSHFRRAHLTEGNYLIYNADTLIKTKDTSQIMNARIEMVGKHKFECVTNNFAGISKQITFKIADAPFFGNMIALINDEEVLTSTYNSFTQKITVTVPSGITKFTLKLDDECPVSCFFPPTFTTIDTTFDFNTGTTEVLGHDLPIIVPQGHLKMRMGSKMEICPNYVCNNTDSITMLGLYSAKHDSKGESQVHTFYDEFGAPINPGTNGSTYSSRKNQEGRTMIIIKDKGALVLEPNSKTHVGAFSTILVRKGGTLLIKAGALLEIGSKEGPGEVIAEDGSFVCISPDAEVRFYKKIGDTVDNNIFYVSKYTNPTVAGCNPLGGGGKFTPLGIHYTSTCMPFCNMKVIGPHYNVGNKLWGWSNINPINASFEMKNIYCLGESVTLNPNKTLNESKFLITILALDKVTGNPAAPEFFIPAQIPIPTKWDSTFVDQPINLSSSFTFNPNNNYRIRLVVKNDCDEKDTFDKVIEMLELPSMNFTLSDIICPGSALSLNGSGLRIDKYVWTATKKEQITHQNDEDIEEDEESWEYISSSVTSGFNFPGYKFNGPDKYYITLTGYNYCGYTEYVDSAITEFGVKLSATKTKLKKSGPVTVVGTVGAATTFQWIEPAALTSSTNLTNNLTLTSTTRFILKASKSGCDMYDTLNVVVGTFANSGRDTIICIGDSILLGDTTTIPSMYTVKWAFDTTLSDSTIKRPWAKPIETTTYTQKVFNGSTLIDSDEITIYVNDTIAPTYYRYQNDTATYHVCFVNNTEPHYKNNSYNWYVNGVSVSTALQLCHTFPTYSRDTFYTVCLSQNNKCGDTMFCDTVFITGTGTLKQGVPIQLKLSNTEVKNISVKLYPNPASDQVFIDIQDTEAANWECYIFDMQGRRVYAKPNLVVSDTEKLNIKLPSGVYVYFILRDGVNVQTGKLIVTRN